MYWGFVAMLAFVGFVSRSVMNAQTRQRGESVLFPQMMMTIFYLVVFVVAFVLQSMPK